MKNLFCAIILLSFIQTINAQKKAFVGETLIDGFGGNPIYNSVILVDGEKIVKVGHQGNTEIPTDAEIVSPLF